MTTASTTAADRQTLLRQLSEKLRRSAGGASDTFLEKRQGFERGFPLAQVRPGMLVEWLTEGPGAGAVALAAAGMDRSALAHRGWIIVDSTGEFYAPGVTVPCETQARRASEGIFERLKIPSLARRAGVYTRM